MLPTAPLSGEGRGHRKEEGEGGNERGKQEGKNEENHNKWEKEDGIGGSGLFSLAGQEVSKLALPTMIPKLAGPQRSTLLT